MPAKRVSAGSRGAPASKKPKPGDPTVETTHDAKAAKPLMPSHAQHLVKVHKALATIRNCPIFSQAATSQPLSLAQGGSEHPFSESSCRVVLKQGRSYACGGNFFWIDHTWLCNHRVPMNASVIKHLMNSKFPHNEPPSCSPFRCTIAVDNENFGISPGSLQRCSPEEIDHAILFSIEKAIESSVGDGVLHSWLQVALHILFCPIFLCTLMMFVFLRITLFVCLSLVCPLEHAAPLLLL